MTHHVLNSMMGYIAPPAILQKIMQVKCCVCLFVIVCLVCCLFIFFVGLHFMCILVAVFIFCCFFVFVFLLSFFGGVEVMVVVFV